MIDTQSLINKLKEEFVVVDGALKMYNGNDSYVEIPTNISSISSAAFYGREKIVEIKITDMINSIEKGSISNCKNLSIITVDSKNTIYDSRSNCNAIIETKNNALILGCKGTEIPNSVEIIGEMAFENCESLLGVTIPCSIVSISKDAFRGCSNLSSIVVDQNNKTYDSRNNCNAIIETANNTLIRGCNNSIIPDGVKCIGAYAFDHCDNLTALNIPISVTSIGVGAFLGCTKLKQITIPDNVVNIGALTFTDCPNIVVRCFEKSYAHKYAIERGIEFELI